MSSHNSDRDPVDQLGKFLMEDLRDRAISHCDALLESRSNAPSRFKLRNDLGSLSEEQQAIVRRCVIFCVDDAIHDFLFRLHERDDSEAQIRLSVDGADVDVLGQDRWGGLHYGPFGEDGWQALYSRYGQQPDEA